MTDTVEEIQEQEEELTTVASIFVYFKIKHKNDRRELLRVLDKGLFFESDGVHYSVTGVLSKNLDGSKVSSRLKKSNCVPMAIAVVTDPPTRIDNKFIVLGSLLETFRTDWKIQYIMGSTVEELEDAFTALECNK